MKRASKIPLNNPNAAGVTLLNQIGLYLFRGLLAGILFEGTFIMFGFEKRIVKGVTSNQLGIFSTI